MSRQICTAAIRGAHTIAAQAEAMLDRALREKGPGAAVEFPNTAYFIPIIYAMTGREVRTLVAGRQAAGAHTVWWDGRDDAARRLSAGLYLCRMTTGNRSASEKLLRIR